MKIIPAIDIMGKEVVRLYKGDPGKKTTYSDDPVAVAKKWQDAGADMIHIVDLDATLGTGDNIGLAEQIAQSITVPVQIAGGLRSEQAIDRAMSCADRIVIGTVAFRDRPLLDKMSKKYGASRIVISVDHINGFIVTHGWQNSTKTPLLDAIKEFTGLGFSEFLLTDVDRDGTMQGPELRHLQMACDIPGANIIASGGISGLRDIQDVKAKNAYAVILGKALYENKITIQESKKC